MDDFFTFILLFLSFMYGLGVTIVCIVLFVNNNKKTEKLRAADKTIAALRRQMGQMRSATAVPSAPQAPVAQPQPQVQPQPQIQARPVATAAPAPSVQRPVAAVQPQPKAAPKAKKEKTKISSINISFAVGVLLITIVGAVFISSSWGFMNDVLRAGVLIGVVALVFFLSYLSGKVLKLRQTGFAFYTLGSLLLPVVTCGIGAMELFGRWFSFNGGGASVVAACAALLFGVAGYVGTRLYKSGAYYGIMYLGFTWTLLFVASQFGSDSGSKTACAFMALAGVSLLSSLALLVKKYEDIRFFKIYSDIISYISCAMTVVMVWSTMLPALIGIVFVVALLFVRGKKTGNRWCLYVLPLASLSLAASAVIVASESFADTDAVQVLIFAAILIGLFIVCEYLKASTFVSDILFPAAVFFAGVGGSLRYDPLEKFDYFVYLFAILAATAVAAWAAIRESGSKVTKAILSVAFAGMSVTCVGSLEQFFFSLIGEDILEKFIGATKDYLRVFDLANLYTLLPCLLAMAAFVLVSLAKRKNIFLRFASYGYLASAFVLSITIDSAYALFTMVLATLVTTYKHAIVPSGEKIKASRILTDILLYLAILCTFIGTFFAENLITLLAVILLIFTLVVRAKNKASYWHVYIIPVYSCILADYLVQLLEYSPALRNPTIQLIIFAIVIIGMYFCLSYMKLNTAFGDIFMPLAILFNLLHEGRVSYTPYNVDISVVSLVIIAVVFILMAWTALYKNSHKAVKTTNAILSSAVSCMFIYSVGTFIFGLRIMNNSALKAYYDSHSWLTLAGRNGARMFREDRYSWGNYVGAVGKQSMLLMVIVALILYLVCSIVLAKKSAFARKASFGYYGAGLFGAVVLMGSSRISESFAFVIAVQTVLLLYTLAALFSRFMASPSKHPDARASIALVAAVLTTGILVIRAFVGDVASFIFISFVILLLGLTLIPQLKKHEIIKAYRNIALIAFPIIVVGAFPGGELFASYPIIPLVFELIILAILYINENTLAALPVIVAVQMSVSAILSPFEGYYAYMCLFGGLMLVAAFFLHRSGLYKAACKVDYMTFLAILCPLNLFGGTNTAERIPSLFAILITIALILASIAIRSGKAGRVLYSISMTMAFFAVLSLELVRNLPKECKAEVIMVLLLLDLFLIRNVIKPGKDSTLRVFWIIAVSVCLVIEGISAAVTGGLSDLLITGIVSVAIFVYAFIAKDKSWFLLSVIAIIAIAIYLSATFWASKAWLVYLLVVGVILISMAAINEYGKRKAELQGEQAEGGGAGVKRFFEEWKW